MADGLTGDFATLEALMRQLRAFPEAVIQQTAPVLRQELLGAVVDGFREGVDPYGQPWAPIAREGQILRDTGVLLNAFSCTATWPLTLTNATPYATYHQDGTARMPARLMVPRPDDLPPRWATPLTDATDLVVRTLAARLPT